jgi:regulator of cell morphogenesis and NO signaling
VSPLDTLRRRHGVMMSSHSTLADLAVTHPGASRVFKRYGLDYCCKGQRSLADACAARHLDPSLVIAELERETHHPRDEARGIEARSSADIVDFIVERYHAPLRQELPQLVAMAERVEKRHGDRDDCPRGLAAHLTRMHAELIDHMAKEEGVLFPLLAAGTKALPAPIGVMQSEHEAHGANLARIRELTAGLVAPPDACATWQALYLRLSELESELMDHIHLENNVLFPRAR